MKEENGTKGLAQAFHRTVISSAIIWLAAKMSSYQTF